MPDFIIGGAFILAWVIAIIVGIRSNREREQRISAQKDRSIRLDPW
jgi:hypothetical protein